MKEILELRINEALAGLVFADDEGTVLRADIRKITIDAKDPRLALIGELQAKTQREKVRPFVWSWNSKRTYSKNELAEASLFQLIVPATIDSSGEEFGTIYDGSVACLKCGNGARRKGRFYFDIGILADKRKDILRTIADEILVSRRWMDIFLRSGLTGCRFDRIWLPEKQGGGVSDSWFLLVTEYEHAEVIAPTVFGNSPFDLDVNNIYRCELGDLVGLNLLSEVTIDSNSRGTQDFISTRQFIGYRRLAQGGAPGAHIILVSPGARKVILSEGLVGASFNIAHTSVAEIR